MEAGPSGPGRRHRHPLSGLGLAMARLLTSTGVRVYGVDTADPPADLANLKTFTAVRGSVTDAGTWRTSHCRFDGRRVRAMEWFRSGT